MPSEPESVYTIGHSNRPWTEFLAMLRAAGVQLVVDVRSVPRSRRNPQYDQAALSQALPSAGIAYYHAAGLGGWRPSRPDSVNTGWRNAAFRSYADYMQTPEFEESLRALIALSQERTVALLCAESLPWRCHRSLIADALQVREIPVQHLIGLGRPREHELTAWAVVRGWRVTYPEAGAEHDKG